MLSWTLRRRDDFLLLHCRLFLGRGLGQSRGMGFDWDRCDCGWDRKKQRDDERLEEEGRHQVVVDRVVVDKAYLVVVVVVDRQMWVLARGHPFHSYLPWHQLEADQIHLGEGSLMTQVAGEDGFGIRPHRRQVAAVDLVLLLQTKEPIQDLTFEVQVLH